MSIIIPANTLAAGGFSVDNSVRMDGASKLTRSFGSAGNRKKWTMSMWVKRSKTGADQKLMGKYTSSSDRFALLFNGSDQLQIFWGNDGGNKQITTNRLFRDTSAFYNFTFIIDTGNSTEADRMQIWVNGVRETSMASTAYPTSGQDLPWNDSGVNEIGSYNNSNKFSGYLAEVVHQNDNAATPVDKFISFDEDTGICVPIDVSGLTLGTNGFYLDFEDSSALGNDASGSNNFTSAGLAAIDQTTDTCTNNFATWNPLRKHLGHTATFSEGNTQVEQGQAGQTQSVFSTIAVSTGKWYAEFQCSSNAANFAFGIARINAANSGGLDVFPSSLGGVAYFKNGNIGSYQSGDANSDTGTTFVYTDIIGILFDLDNTRIYFYKNDTLVNSGGFNYSVSTDTAGSSLETTYYFSAGGNDDGTNPILQANFGGSSGFAISSGNADGNGFGNFEYATKGGYALCTKNLSEFG